MSHKSSCRRVCYIPSFEFARQRLDVLLGNSTDCDESELYDVPLMCQIEKAKGGGSFDIFGLLLNNGGPMIFFVACMQ